MPQGYIKGLRLGTTSAMELKCAASSVHKCDHVETGVHIISVSENPVTRISYVYFEIPQSIPNGLYDVFLTTRAGIVSGNYDLGAGLQFIGDATISGFITDPSGISNTFVTITGSNLLKSSEGFAGTKFYLGDIQISLESDQFNPPEDDLAMFKVPGHMTLTGLDADYNEFHKSGIVSFPASVSNVSGTNHTGDREYDVIPAPHLYGFSPLSGSSGINVEISGTNFINTDKISLGGAFNSNGDFVGGQTGIANNASFETGLITFTTPDLPAKYPIWVFATGGYVESDLSFEFLLGPPTISGFHPTSVPRNAIISMSGDRLASSDIIQFSGDNGISEITNFITDDAGLGKIRLNIPNDAIDGQIRVINENGFAISADVLRILQGPKISGMAKYEGAYEEHNSISGRHLSGARVFFYGISGFDVEALNTYYSTGVGNEIVINFQTPREILRDWKVRVSGIDVDTGNINGLGTSVTTDYPFHPIPTVSGWYSTNMEDKSLVRMEQNGIVITGVNALYENVTHIVVSGDNQAAGWSINLLVDEGEFSVYQARDETYGLTSYHTGDTIYSGLLTYDSEMGFMGTGKLMLYYDSANANTNLTTGYFGDPFDIRYSEATQGNLEFRNNQDWFEIGGYGLFGLWSKQRDTNIAIIRDFRAPYPTVDAFSPNYAYGDYDSNEIQLSTSTEIQVQGTALFSATGIQISGFDSYPNNTFGICIAEDDCGHVFEVIDDSNVKFYVPENFSGSGFILVHNSLGEIATSTGILKNVRPMNISGFLPPEGNEPYQVYKIIGDNLDFVKSVKFGEFVVSGYDIERLSG
jgi:hypothetical protein